MTRGAIRRIGIAASAATLCLSLTAGAAFAGEVTGKGKPTPIAEYRAASICSFSGYNDGHPPPGRTAAHVQSWGQIPKAVRDVIALEGEHPGDACNGHTGFLAGG
ncbi:MAG TPA: hypothetical protein VFK54_11175 [Candidatus Limnocylindrales bacterium]|nr:hypothetical protein [Candidatus Limnocylindrales bacterium]